MEKLLVALVVFTVVLFETSSALDRLVVNADNRINKLYIDGVDRTAELVNRGNFRQCDKIDIPMDSGVIAIEASNVKNYYGIHACETSSNAVYDGWRCKQKSKVESGWYLPDYPANGWELSEGFECVKHCRKFYKHPCPLYATKCYWTNTYVPTVRCRIKLCADNCKKCDVAGPGKCDAGQCQYGGSIDPVTGEQLCCRRCAIEVKGQSYLDGDKPGYIKIWDPVTMAPTILDMSTPGFHAVAINVSTCSFYETKYIPNSLDGIQEYFTLTGTLENGWGVGDSVYTNLVGIVILVGNGYLQAAPYFGRYISLGLDGATSGSSNYAGSNPCLYRATFEGCPNELATLVVDEELVPFDSTNLCNP